MCALRISSIRVGLKSPPLRVSIPLLTEIPLSDMYKSLCKDDFYPLIHNCTRYMSYEEKVVHRLKHGIPGTIDEWIEDGKEHTKEPTANPHNHKYILLQDTVECIFNIVCKKVSFLFFT